MYHVFQRVPQHNDFWVKDGKELHSLPELALALREMKISTFRYHVNKQKNDLSEWVRNTLNEKEIADKLARIVTKDKAELILLRYLCEKLTQQV
jgi:hypothetical protein